jgi:hypothetical protein
MADLGSIGIKGCETKSLGYLAPLPPYSGRAFLGCSPKVSQQFGYPAVRLQSLVAGATSYVFGGEDLVEGFSSAPCLRMDAKGSWRFRWALTVATHSITVYVKQAINQSPRPSLCVKANPSIGILTDIEVFAPSSTDWVAVSSGSFAVTTLGATWVELRCNLETNVGFFPCYWDSISKS